MPLKAKCTQFLRIDHTHIYVHAYICTRVRRYRTDHPTDNPRYNWVWVSLVVGIGISLSTLDLTH